MSECRPCDGTGQTTAAPADGREGRVAELCPHCRGSGQGSAAERRVAELEQAIRDHRDTLYATSDGPHADSDRRLWAVLGEET